MNHIVCISVAVYNSLPASGQKKSTVIANPVDAPSNISKKEASKALHGKLGIAQEENLIGYVGNMTRQKRPLVFIRAASFLRRELNSNSHFVIVGDNRGGELDAVKSLARQLGLGEYVHFVGFQLPIEPFVAGFDLLIAPGVNEAFGRTVAEAMIAGTPVVAAASGGHIELLDNGRYGLLALPDDEVSIALSAARLLETTTLRARFAQAAHERAVHAFGVTEHVSELSKLYESISQRGKRSV